MRPQPHAVAGSALASLLVVLVVGCMPVSPQSPEARPGAVTAPASMEPSPQLAPSYPTGTAMAAISQRGTLRVATLDSRPRLALTDPFTGEVGGFDVAMASLLAQRLLGTARDDAVDVLTEEDPLEALRQGRVDLVLAGVDSEDVPADLVGVGPYVEGARVAMAPLEGPVDEVADLADRRVCVRAGEAADLELVVDATAVEAPSLLECAAALGRGGLVAAFGDDLELFGVADAYPGTMQLLPTGLADVGYVIVLRPEARALRDHVSDALADVLRSEEWAQAWIQNLGPTPPAPPDVR